MQTMGFAEVRRRDLERAVASLADEGRSRPKPGAWPVGLRLDNGKKATRLSLFSNDEDTEISVALHTLEFCSYDPTFRSFGALYSWGAWRDALRAIRSPVVRISFLSPEDVLFVESVPAGATVFFLPVVPCRELNEEQKDKDATEPSHGEAEWRAQPQG